MQRPTMPNVLLEIGHLLILFQIEQMKRASTDTAAKHETIEATNTGSTQIVTGNGYHTSQLEMEQQK